MRSSQQRPDADGGPPFPRLQDADPSQVLDLLREHRVRFLRLQFTDILGVTKNLEVPAGRFGKALDGQLMFDGSSMESFERMEETDMLLRPDLDSLVILPWSDPDLRVARLVCDVHRPDGRPFEGDPRAALKRVVQELADEGYEPFVGVEAEFFLLQSGGGTRSPAGHFSGGYFDHSPVGEAEAARREMVVVLEAMGFDVEVAHHEVAPGQQEILFRYEQALTAADHLATLKAVVHQVAGRHGLRATFMPKPFFGQNGSGVHTHQSLFRSGENAFHDPEARDGLSEVLRFYVGGLLRHARGYCAVTNPLVNSYKRLVPGYEAPSNVAWSLHSHSPMVRVPARRGKGTRCELRLPDPAANPYLALTVQLAAGLDGIRSETNAGEPVNKDIGGMSERERRRLGILSLPRDLGEALTELEANRVIRAALGEYIFSHFVAAKRAEWEEYSSRVHDWELEKYLDS